MKGILLYDTAGRKYDGAVKSAVKRLMPGATPHSQTNVLTGELLVDYYQEGQPFNYQVYDDPNILLYCEVHNVSPLAKEEFHLLESISRPGDRIEAFRQLDFGMTLREGSSVTVALPGANLSAPKRARAVVHYKGKVGNQLGTLFGVEILDKTQRRAEAGVTDGTFQGHRYFTCDQNCGLFVSLRWLSPADGQTAGTSLNLVDRQRGDNLRPSYSQVSGGDPNTRSRSKPPFSKASTDGSPSATQRPQGPPSKGKTSESSVDPASPRFVVGQYVMFYDNNGDKHYGTVGWTGKKSRTRVFAYTVVGIRTDEAVFKSNFEHCLPGMDHLLSARKRHALFLPEALLDEIPNHESSPRPARSGTAQEIAQALNMSETTLAKQQIELLEEAERVKTAEQDQATLKALEAAEQSINITRQAEHYKRLCAESTAQGHVQDDRNIVAQQQEALHYEAEKRARDMNKAAGDFGDQIGDSKHPNAERRPSNHVYNDPDQHPSSHSYDNPDKIHYEGGHKQAGSPFDARHTPSSQRSLIHETHSRDTQHPHIPQHYEEKRPQEVKTVIRDDSNYPHADHSPPSRSQSNPQVSGRGALKVGSPIQLPAVDGSIKYGTIRWMGHVPNVSEEIAGLEMDDSIEGCTDGTFQATGQQFFMCSPGKGLYYPLKNLVSVDECHLKQLYLQLKKENVSLSQHNAALQAESQQQTDELKRENVSLTRLQAESQQRINELTNTLLLTQPFFSIAELNTVSRAEIERIPKKRIGFGAWGEVYSARFRGEDVAIKIAHREILRQSVDMLKREIQIMSSVQHPNLVRFIGAVMDDAVERKMDTPIIISELMDMNLRAAYERKLDLSGSLMSIFRDVAYALQYLHQHREPIIHRDISAPNVLLKSLPGGSYRAKVSDFGSANLVKNSTTAAAGAIIYSAPEMFPSEGIAARRQLPKQTPKVDVYSYGILLLEVIAKEMPSQDTSYDLLQKVKGQWNTMYALIVHCTKRSPSDRPTMADILKQLNSAPH